MITPSIATALLECFAIIDQNINILACIFQCQVTIICMDILFREMHHSRPSVPFILHAAVLSLTPSPLLWSCNACLHTIHLSFCECFQSIKVNYYYCVSGYHNDVISHYWQISQSSTLYFKALCNFVINLHYAV